MSSRKITFNFGFASRYLLAMILKQDHGYHVRLSGNMLIVAMSVLFALLVLITPAKANSIYLPVIVNTGSGGTIPPDHKFGPPIHRDPIDIKATKISIDIAFKNTNGQAIDYVNTMPRSTTTITDVSSIDLEFGDMLVNGSAAYTYVYHTKTIMQGCIMIKVYLDMPDNKFMTVTAVGCYDKLTDNLSPDEQYNDVYNATNQIIDLVNPNPAMFYTWDLTLLQP